MSSERQVGDINNNVFFNLEIRTGGSCSRCNLGEKLWIQMIKLTLLVVTAPFPSDHTASNERTLYIEHYDV